MRRTEVLSLMATKAERRIIEQAAHLTAESRSQFTRRASLERARLISAALREREEEEVEG